jgi:hypothetical protein
VLTALQLGFNQDSLGLAGKKRGWLNKNGNVPTYFNVMVMMMMMTMNHWISGTS